MPMASNAVFQIAKRNECWLQPFLIVWISPEAGIPNKVVVAFGNAIETTGLTAKEIRERWEWEVSNEIERIKL